MSFETVLKVVRSRHLQGFFLLTFATVLWGSTFVVIKQTVDFIPPSVLILVRFALAAVFFVPFLQRDRKLVQGGLELSIWLGMGYATQAIALQYTTASRCAFINALYVIFLPLLLGCLGQRIRLPIALSAVLAVVGVGLLSYDASKPNIGDVWSLGTALSWTLYIWRLEVYATRFNTLSLTATQIWGLLGFSLIWVGLSHPAWLHPGIWVWQLPWQPILYLGVLGTALTVWIQTWGQRLVSAPVAAIIYTQEPVWASLFAYIVLREILGMQGLLGASFIVLAIFLSQLPTKFSPRCRKTSASDAKKIERSHNQGTTR
jgi:drug/metabolite transporter (DMT)-like permease